MMDFEKEKKFRLQRQQSEIRRDRWLLVNAWWLIAVATALIVWLVTGH